MNSAAIRVGRLLEIRPVAYRSAADMALAFSTIANELTKLAPGTLVVTVTDWRYCPVMSEDASEHALVAITNHNPRVLRSGVLASKDSSVAVLQLRRLMRQRKHDSHRLFFSEDELTAWLGEVLTEAEKTRLTAFLNEPVQA